MNKLIGYMTINIEGEEIPLKLGAGAMREFLKLHGISLAQIGTIFHTVSFTHEGKEIELPTPNDPFQFAAAVLWAGADFANRRQGGTGFSIEAAYDWIDELGGLDSDPIKKAYKLFFEAVKNGGSPQKELPEVIAGKKKPTKK